MTLVVSLGVPTLLCCLPLLSTHQHFPMLCSIVAALVFYSFLLLPSALMLDFRRDVHRLDVLKSLPLHPLAVTLGQLATPVLLSTMFQWTVLLIAVAGWSDLIVARDDCRAPAAPHQCVDFRTGKCTVYDRALPPKPGRTGGFSENDPDIYRQRRYCLRLDC